jgi:histidyl-tRNA synthetase
MEKPTLPKGTRDFGPAQMARRQFIFNNIRTVFQKYGFQPLETPAMENLTTLTGKYGEEGDQLLFKVLDTGTEGPAQRLRERIRRVDVGLVKYSLELAFIKFNTDFYNRIENQNLISKDKGNPHSYKDILINQFEPFRESFFKQSPFNQVEFLQLKNFLHSDRDHIISLTIESLVLNANAEDFGKNVKEQKFETFYLNNEKEIRLDIAKYSDLIKDITEKGLRYDLTVPFARYVVMNRGEITFPFKRYQMQPVWRADRPQKGRYREFYQCDADVVGTDSLICEAEIILMIKEVFSALGIADYTIKVNHRGILSGLAELTGTTNETALFVAIDKLDKIGEEKVREELAGKGFTTESLNTVFEILNFKGTTAEKIQFLTERFTTSASGARGITDFRAVLHLLADYGVNEEHVEFDIALARGLSYYTGCIFEVKINNVAMGSVSGGGRYDNLTQAFGIKERLSGVGISFGIDRIYDCMDELKLFPESAQATSKVLICHFDEESKRYGLKVLSTLRHSGIASEIYPDTVKINKQLDYANRKSIPYTLVIGSDEVKSGVLTFKDMKKGEQSKYSMEEIVNKLTADN